MPAGAQGPWETEEERAEAARGARRVERQVDRGGAVPLPPGPQSPSHPQTFSLPHSLTSSVPSSRKTSGSHTWLGLLDHLHLDCACHPDVLPSL